MDVSSEMIHGLRPVFLVASPGASTVAIGLLEGVAEATAAIVKVFAKTLSDWLDRRRPRAPGAGRRRDAAAARARARPG